MQQHHFLHTRRPNEHARARVEWPPDGDPTPLSTSKKCLTSKRVLLSRSFQRLCDRKLKTLLWSKHAMKRRKNEALWRCVRRRTARQRQSIAVLPLSQRGLPYLEAV